MADRERTVAFFDAYPHVAGGAHAVALALARHLPEHGWQVHWLLPGPGPLETAVRALADEVPGITAERVDAPAALSHFGGATTGRRLLSAWTRFPGYTAALARRLRTVDAAYAIDPRGVLVVGPAACIVRTPVVWHLHTVSEWNLANRVGSLLANRVVTVSDAVASQSAGLGLATVARNPLLRRPERAEPRSPSTDIGCIARLHPEKGIDLLIDAVALLVRRHPDLRVHVLGGEQAGAESHATELRARIAGSGLHDHVDLVGHVDDPFGHLADCGLYLQTSRREGLPLAVAEAMAHGFPVVATDCPGMSDVVRDGVNGRLVAQRPDAIAEAVGALLDDPAEGRRLAAGGIETAAALDDADAYGARWATILDEVVAR